MATVVRMPQLAAGGQEAAIQAWLVAVGEPVAVGQTIVEIETEKAIVEHEAEVEGVLAGILVEAGESASVGAPIAVLAAPGESTDDALRLAGVDAAVDPPPAPATETSGDPGLAPPAPVAETETAPAPAPAPARHAPGDRLFASPLVRRLAKERGIDLRGIAGSGPNGRVVRRDLDSWSGPASDEEVAAASPAAADEGGGAAFVDIPHTPMRRAIARRLTESASTVPDFQLVANCRVDELLALRAKANEHTEPKLSVNDFVVKAVACAMSDVPDANAVWTDAALRRFSGVDIAVAVSVPAGLVTPVVRDVDRLSLTELGASIRDLAGRAREGRLRQAELEGGSFSVSNLGMYGTEQFSAIINPPHSGILAVGAAGRRPIVGEDGALAVATVMTVTLTADHRVMDGALAAQWLAAFVRRIENPVSMLI